LLVYKLYDLTYDECKTVDPEFDKVLAEFGLGKEEYDSITNHELRITNEALSDKREL
jgi:propanediol dehydratase small subunit